jgi:putative nucleotidyltransferase with HDIG domain
MLTFQPGPGGGAEKENHRKRVAALARCAGRVISLTGGLFPAADLLNTCDEFDDAVESAIFERIHLWEAMTDYLSVAECVHSPEAINALRTLTRAVPRTGVTLPVLPSALSRVLNCHEEELDARSLASIAAKDQVLAGRLLSVANSTIHGTEHKIVSLREAAMRLGVPLARKAFLQACVGGLFASARLRDLWCHAQFAAAVSAELAFLVNLDANTAYAAGLLHDIGRLEWAMDTPANQCRVDLWLTAGFPVVYAESMVYASDHAQTGAQILRSWRLPSEIVAGVAGHHTPEYAESPLASVLFIAEVCCERHKGSPSEGLNTSLRLRVACERLGLPVTVVDRIEAEARLFALAAGS